MDLSTALTPILFIGFGGIALGSIINYRRLSTGMGPSALATALQGVSIVVVLVAAALAMLTVVVDAGIWQIAAVVLAMAAVAGFAIAGSTHTSRSRQH